jgi:hypothetical protein
MEADIESAAPDEEDRAKIAVKRVQTKSVYPLRLKVNFRSEKDCQKFAVLIHQDFSTNDKEVPFTPPHVGTKGPYKFTDFRKRRKKPSSMSAFHAKHWLGMPEFVQESSEWTYFSVKMVFETAVDYAAFANLVRQHLNDKTKSIYFPKWTPEKARHKKWVSDLPIEEITPRYPIYIVSRGRAHSRYTSKTLEAMNVPYFIVIEPAEYETYASVIDPKKILVLPYDTDPSNPTGPGRARNWCREHSWSNGYDRHWVMDDNLQGFYRLHQNKRYRVADGAVFRAAEDFVDRYENIWVAGFQYFFFCASKSKYPPFVANTRIYSCLLIDNRLMLEMPDGRQFLWRERYNEDTILSLDVLENEYCTVQFNAFLQGKLPTQSLKGGNTETFYDPEGGEDIKDVKVNNYNQGGTVRKSLNLKLIYPEVTETLWKYGRWHHKVDYSRYKNNALRLRKEAVIPAGVNNYGMRLVTMTANEVHEQDKLEKQHH